MDDDSDGTTRSGVKNFGSVEGSGAVFFLVSFSFQKTFTMVSLLLFFADQLYLVLFGRL
jgi:hypothetical protein